jgi:hypothetical protein
MRNYKHVLWNEDEDEDEDGDGDGVGLKETVWKRETYIQ